MPDPNPDKSDISDYLESSDVLDFDHPLVSQTAQQLTYGLKDNLSKAREIYEFTRDHIFHSVDIDATSVTKTASEVLDKGHGICFAKAHLLAALMRASGIPTGFCYQIRYYEDLERLIAHGFNGVYIQELDKWVRIDACFQVDVDDWGFDPFKESTIKSVREEIGESDDFTIYHTPSKKILKVLSAANTVEELMHLIPSEI
ncbi:MAG: transglutaminase domain-containing protein [Clostridiaceae bacterium]|jgi:citrate lyase gamma subunit|nr:transglutaminase domain-containing protein [Clostridiaceae bacterium]